MQGFQLLHILCNTCFLVLFFDNTHPNWCEVVPRGFVCILLMISNIEHLFMWWLAVYTSFWRNIYSCLLLIFYYDCLLLSCRSTIYILDIHPLSDIWFANISPPLCGLPFSSLGLCTKVYNFDEVQFVCFSFTACDFGVTCKKSLPNPMLWSFPIFFKAFYGLTLTFRDLIWILLESEAAFILIASLQWSCIFYNLPKC